MLERDMLERIGLVLLGSAIVLVIDALRPCQSALLWC